MVEKEIEKEEEKEGYTYFKKKHGIGEDANGAERVDIPEEMKEEINVRTR